MAQLQNELAERELIKKFRHDNSWLSQLTEKPQWVGNDVIKVPRRGNAPMVLINNNIYPILTNNRDDDFITLALHRYDTTNTPVTDDELYALPYEKISDVQLQHREELEDKTAEHALYSLAPAAASANLPILETTGPINGVTGLRRLITADLITLGTKLSEMKVPLKGRSIVLSPNHLEDLTVEDSNRSKNWSGDFSQGTAPQFHAGFNMWAATYPPRYTKVSGVWTRSGFEAIVGVQASVVFFKGNAVKATGSVKRYAAEASGDPFNRRTVLGFRLYFVAVGTMDEGFAAIVSGS